MYYYYSVFRIYVVLYFWFCDPIFSFVNVNNNVTLTSAMRCKSICTLKFCIVKKSLDLCP